MMSAVVRRGQEYRDLRQHRHRAAFPAVSILHYHWPVHAEAPPFVGVHGEPSLAPEIERDVDEQRRGQGEPEPEILARDALRQETASDPTPKLCRIQRVGEQKQGVRTGRTGVGTS